MQKATITATAFNYELHLKELNERFSRLIRQVGRSNEKGTVRYKFEVDFSYALNEIKNGPAYLQGKLFDSASSIIGSLITHVKNLRETSS